jgi:adenylate cyclase
MGSDENRVYREIVLNILPEFVATKLVAGKPVRPKVYRKTTIMFTDVVSFSRIAVHLDPVALIHKLNHYFSIYDRVMEEFGIEKIKTIGDSYMCVSGVPSKKPSHAIDCCLAALNILHLMAKMREEERIVEGLDLNNWAIRIGIHTGPCISGVVGYKKYSFDIWGDSVNIAARMEESGEAGKINISESTFREVKDLFECPYRGQQRIGQIGPVGMYFLERLKPELSEDERGYFPNATFTRRYLERFASGESSEVRRALPDFIKNLLGVREHERAESVSTDQI